jgi:hypothetical protein
MSPRKSSFRHAQKIYMSALSVRIATKLLHMHPHGKSAIHEIYDTHREARGGFVNWCLPGVLDRELDMTLFLFSEETWFSLQWISEIQE